MILFFKYIKLVIKIFFVYEKWRTIQFVFLIKFIKCVFLFFRVRWTRKRNTVSDGRGNIT